MPTDCDAQSNPDSDMFSLTVEQKDEQFDLMMSFREWIIEIQRLFGEVRLKKR